MRLRFGVEEIGLKMQISVGEEEEVRLQWNRSAAIRERAGVKYKFCQRKGSDG